MLVFAVWLICVLVIIGLSAWLDQKYAITLNALKADIIICEDALKFTDGCLEASDRTILEKNIEINGLQGKLTQERIDVDKWLKKYLKVLTKNNDLIEKLYGCEGYDEPRD